MLATLFLKGERHRLYTLSVKGESEVDELLIGQHADKHLKKVVANFLNRLQYAAERGFWNLPKEWRDCWQETKPKGLFCEFKSHDYKISYFFYPEGRVLLVT